MREFENMKYVLQGTLENSDEAWPLRTVATVMERKFDVTDRDVFVALRDMGAVIRLER